MRLKLLLTILLLVFVVSASFQVQAQHRNKCPAYMWSVQYTPVTYLGFEKAPASISYTTDGGNEIDGKFPMTIGFRNLSGKNIKALKFEWYLFYKDAYQNTQAENWMAFLEKITLSHGEISIADTGEFKPTKDFEPEVKLPCEEIYEKVGDVDVKELIKNKNEMIMEFVVREISFNDGSNWKRK